MTTGGGDKMLQETMQEVRKTEDKASQMLADAVANGEELLKKTEAEIEAGKAETKLKSKQYDESVMGKVKAEEERLTQAAMNEAQGQIGQIQKLVAEKEAEAIRIIIGEIV